jgi:hypothetical protein
MLGYKEEDILSMIYGVSSADLLIDADENPAIHNYLVMTSEFLEGLLAEGHIQ